MDAESQRGPFLVTFAESRRKLRSELVMFIGWVLLLATALYLRPSPQLHGTHTQLGLPPCGFYLFFHRPCPTCGLTTAFSATAHLDIPTALRAHAVGPALFLFISVIAVGCGWSFFTGRKIVCRDQWLERAFVLIVVATVVFGVARLSWM